MGNLHPQLLSFHSIGNKRLLCTLNNIFTFQLFNLPSFTLQFYLNSNSLGGYVQILKYFNFSDLLQECKTMLYLIQYLRVFTQKKKLLSFSIRRHSIFYGTDFNKYNFNHRRSEMREKKKFWPKYPLIEKEIIKLRFQIF